MIKRTTLTLVMMSLFGQHAFAASYADEQSEVDDISTTASEYVLTESNQDSSFLFEEYKDESNENKTYILERISTPSGTEYYFKLDETVPPTEVSNWIMSFPSGSSEDAIKVCSLDESGFGQWRSPSNAEVESAMVSRDPSFVEAMESTSTTMVQGHTNNGAFYYSNYSGTGATMDSLGGKPTPTLCIQD